MYSFNPSAKFPFSIVQKEYVFLANFAKKNDTENTSDTNNINIDLINAGIEMQTKIGEAKIRIENKLIEVFFGIPDYEVDNLEIETRFNLINQIRQEKPSLMAFLMLD